MVFSYQPDKILAKYRLKDNVKNAFYLVTFRIINPQVKLNVK